MATNSEQSYEDWLERENFDEDFTDMDDSEIKRYIDDIWNRQDYKHTDTQLEALKDAVRRSRPESLAGNLVKQESYYRHMGGKFYPRLASRGIKRVTYESLGTRFTRYVIPGSRGLYSLESARKIFQSL